MAAKMKLLFRLYALYARMDLNWFLQDTKTCLLVILSDLVVAASQVAGVALLAERFSGIGQMSSAQVLWMMAFYMLSDGALMVLFGSNNVHQISRRVGRGQLDHMLMQPVPLKMQLLSEGFMPVSGSSGLLAGLALLIVTTLRLGVSVTPLWTLMLLLLILCRVAIEMGLSFALATGAFYRPVACEEISSLGHDLINTIGRFPLFGLPPLLTGILMTMLPSGLMAFLPSLILLGIAPPAYLWLPIAVAACFMALATRLFRKGLRHYAEVSCNRYRDMGHRG